jgi:hypothetical protein
MDTNDVDVSLHEIEQMALVAVNAHESLVGSDTPLVFSKCRRKIPSYFPLVSMTS